MVNHPKVLDADCAFGHFEYAHVVSCCKHTEKEKAAVVVGVYLCRAVWLCGPGKGVCMCVLMELNALESQCADRTRMPAESLRLGRLGGKRDGSSQERAWQAFVAFKP